MSAVHGTRPAAVSFYSPSTHPSRVLSVQSTVVYGYVGNKASCFALQLLGLDVDPIHSCQLSNHTGYREWHGRQTSGSELDTLVQALVGTGVIHEYRYLLTGYLSNVDFANSLLSLVPALKQRLPRLTFLCDPVMGDLGHLYVPKEFVSVYQSLIQYSDIVTPNQTEAELLTNTVIHNEEQAVHACELLHSQGPMLVVLTSIHWPTVNEDELTIIASQKGSDHYLYLSVPRLAGYFSGTGDLTAALLLAHWSKTGDLQVSLERTITSVQAVMTRTLQAQSSELVLIPSADDIRCPDQCAVQYQAKPKTRVKRDAPAMNST